MNVENKFAKEIEDAVLREKPMPPALTAVPGTARGDIMSAQSLLAAIGNDIVTLQKALTSMASAVERMQGGLKEAHETIAKAAGRL